MDDGDDAGLDDQDIPADGDPDDRPYDSRGWADEPWDEPDDRSVPGPRPPPRPVVASTGLLPAINDHLGVLRRLTEGLQDRWEESEAAADAFQNLVVDRITAQGRAIEALTGRVQAQEGVLAAVLAWSEQAGNPRADEVDAWSSQLGERVEAMAETLQRVERAGVVRAEGHEAALGSLGDLVLEAQRLAGERAEEHQAMLGSVVSLVRQAQRLATERAEAAGPEASTKVVLGALADRLEAATAQREAEQAAAADRTGTALETVADRLDAAAEREATQIAAFGALAALVQDQGRHVAGRLEALAAAGAASSIGALIDRVDEQARSFNAVVAAIEHDDEPDERFVALVGRLDELGPALESVQARFEQAEAGRDDGFHELASRLAAQADEVRAAIEGLSATLVERSFDHERSLRELAERLGERDDELVQPVGRADAAPGTDAALEAFAQRIDEQSAAVMAALGSLDRAAQQSRSRQEHSVEALAALVDRQGQALAGLVERLDRSDADKTDELTALATGSEEHTRILAAVLDLLESAEAPEHTFGEALGALEARLAAAVGDRAEERDRLEQLAGAADRAGVGDGADAVDRAVGSMEAAVEQMRAVVAEFRVIEDVIAETVDGPRAAGPDTRFDQLRDELMAELATVRDDVGQLRRRLPLRAAEPAFDADHVAEVVAAAVEARTASHAPRLRPDEATVDLIARGVAKRLAQMFEVTNDDAG
ncbi:MAG: hypothetical protein ACT4PW_01255 [Acidimicrobiia bacterium]